MKSSELIILVIILILTLPGQIFSNSPSDSMVWFYINDDGSGMKDENGDPISHGGFTGYMSKYETTNAQYCEYLNAALASGDVVIQIGDVYGNIGPYNGQIYYDMDDIHAQISYSGGTFFVETRDGYDMSDHPVVEVSWYGATAFASYYGWRLPTEWEWQTVADYDGSFTYGCGTTISQSKANYNYANPFVLSRYPYTSPVGYYPAYGYCMCDMAGNVWEWTDSCYYSDCAPDYRVVRGGAWGSYGATYCEVSYRLNNRPGFTDLSIGFRVCRDRSEEQIIITDDFNDNTQGSMWKLYEDEHSHIWVDETNQRLEVRANTSADDEDALYGSDNWGISTSNDFQIKVDFYYNLVTENWGKVFIGIAPLSPDLINPAYQDVKDVNHISFVAGCDDDYPIFWYEQVTNGALNDSDWTARDSDGGTLYISYDSGLDELYLSSAGYGACNAWKTFSNLIQGQWEQPLIGIGIGGNSDGVSMPSGDAYLDNFIIDQGRVLNIYPDFDDDNDVDFADFAIFAKEWMEPECGLCQGAEFTGDGNVDFNDLAVFTSYWF